MKGPCPHCVDTGPHDAMSPGRWRCRYCGVLLSQINGIVVIEGTARAALAPATAPTGPELKQQVLYSACKEVWIPLKPDDDCQTFQSLIERRFEFAGFTKDEAYQNATWLPSSYIVCTLQMVRLTNAEGSDP